VEKGRVPRPHTGQSGPGHSVLTCTTLMKVQRHHSAESLEIRDLRNIFALYKPSSSSRPSRLTADTQRVHFQSALIPESQSPHLVDAVC